MKIASHQERTIVLLLGGFVLGILALFAMACGDPSTDVDDIEHEPAAEVDGIKQASWCFGFPYRVMNFPVNQGAWKGDGAGQVSVAPFWNGNCPPPGTEMGYGQEDGKINLNQETTLPYNSCVKTASNTVFCSGQAFVCPANACITEPVTWQLEPTAPNNSVNWGWSQWSAISSTQSAAPGNHGIWPKVPTQCSNGAPTIQFNPNGSGGATLACHYPMGTYWLRQN